VGYTTPTGIPGFTFGGVHSSNFGIFMQTKKYHVLPQTRDIEQVIYGRPGVYDVKTEHGNRLITLDLVVVGNDRTDCINNIHAFSAAINPMNGYQQLIFDDDPDFYYMAKYTSSGQQPEVTYSMNTGAFTVQFKCDSPFKYAVTPQNEWWPAPYQGTVTLTNNGNQPCPVQIQIQPPSAAQPPGSAGLGTTGGNGANSVTGVTITINGDTVTYTGEITGNDVVVIDTGNFTVTKNGQNALQYWEGDFPQLQPGQNTVTEHDQSGVGANITFIYDEIYL
jgi:predicted phage tail component-like protein